MPLPFPQAKPAAAAWLGVGADCSTLLRFPAGGHLGRAFEGQRETVWCGLKRAQTKGLDVEEQWSAVSPVPSERSRVMLFVFSDP